MMMIIVTKKVEIFSVMTGCMVVNLNVAVLENFDMPFAMYTLTAR